MQLSWSRFFGTRKLFLGFGLLIIGLSVRGAIHDVGVYDHFFEPFQLSIQTGDTVEWTAYGFGHTLISDTRLFDSSTVWGGSIPALFSFKFTFHEPGTYPYYSVDYGGPEGAGMSGTITVTGNPTNQIPAAPANSFPAAGATDSSIRGELRASAFADGDPGDVHLASQWIVRRASDGQLIYDSGEVVDNGLTSNSKTNRFLPDGIVSYGTVYQWQVRYRDSYGAWSGHSAATSFATAPPRLRTIRSNTSVVFLWPTNTEGFVLEYATNLSSPGWNEVAEFPSVIAGEKALTNSIAAGTRLYRLRKP